MKESIFTFILLQAPPNFCAYRIYYANVKEYLNALEETT